MIFATLQCIIDRLMTFTLFRYIARLRDHHHFICPIIQQYAHLHEYDSRRAGQQGRIKTLTATLKRSIKTVNGYTFYHTNKKYYKREKLEKSIHSILFLKTFKDAKFVVDANAFQTFITLSTKNFCLMLAVHLGLNSLYL